jgi:XapX domain-containing protein
MKVYLVTLGVGMLAGLVYSITGVRSPAPPLVALLGLTGILIGQQIVPIAMRLSDPLALAEFIRDEVKPDLLGVPNPPDKL